MLLQDLYKEKKNTWKQGIMLFSKLRTPITGSPSLKADRSRISWATCSLFLQISKETEFRK
jgi:hypothetical protein